MHCNDVYTYGTFAEIECIRISSVATGVGARAPYCRQAWPQDSCKSDEIFFLGGG